jgi:hypothetical protein
MSRGGGTGARAALFPVISQISIEGVKMSVDLNQVAEDMFKMVEKDRGSKKYKPSDLFKAMMIKHESEGITKKDCKNAIRQLIDGERLNYTYFNGTFVEIPGIEGAAMAAEEAARHS